MVAVLGMTWMKRFTNNSKIYEHRIDYERRKCCQTYLQAHSTYFAILSSCDDMALSSDLSLNSLNLSYIMHLLTPQSLVNAVVLSAAHNKRADRSPS